MRDEWQQNIQKGVTTGGSVAFMDKKGRMNVVLQHGPANQEILTRISRRESLFSHSFYILAQPHLFVKKDFS